jgi:hypothetical protein
MSLPQRLFGLSVVRLTRNGETGRREYRTRSSLESRAKRIGGYLTVYVALQDCHVLFDRHQFPSFLFGAWALKAVHGLQRLDFRMLPILRHEVQFAGVGTFVGARNGGGDCEVQCAAKVGKFSGP